MRIFIAVDISAEAKKEIEKLLKFLKKKHWPVKWEKPEKLHQTLVFLGNIKNQTLPAGRQEPKTKNTNLKIDKIRQAIEKACKDIEPFEISFKGLGCFPNYDYVRVIWLGLKGDLKSLALLQKNIVKEIQRLDVFTHGRDQKRQGKSLGKTFSPHITLGRIKKARTRERREIGRQLRKLRIMPARLFGGNLESRIMVDRIVIYESKLSPKGSIYRKLQGVYF